MADPATPAPTTPPAAAAAPTPAPSVLGATATTTPPATGTQPPAGTAPATAPTPAVADGEIKLTAPKDGPLTEDHVKQVTEFAKANKLTQAQAEKILERDAQGAQAQTAAQKAAVEAQAKTNFQAFEQLKVDGAKAWSEDKDFGGPKLQKSTEDATRAVAKFADPELQKFLAQHPLGSDPLVLRMLARIGATLREDSTLAGGNGQVPKTPEGDAASRMMATYRTPAA